MVSWKIWQHCNEVVFKGQTVLADGFILSDVEGHAGWEVGQYRQTCK